MRELKSNFGLHAMRKHGFMANWVWLLLVCAGHNLCCWTQQLGELGAGRDKRRLRAKRLRYRYLVVPAMLVRSGRQHTRSSPPATRSEPGSSPRSNDSDKCDPQPEPHELTLSRKACSTTPQLAHGDPRSPQERPSPRLELINDPNRHRNQPTIDQPSTTEGFE